MDLPTRLEIIFCGVFLLIPRLVIYLTMMLFLQIFVRVGCIGLDFSKNTDKPDCRGLRYKIFLYPAMLCFRVMYLCMGVHWIGVKGEPADSKKAPIRIAAPHSSMLDTSIMCAIPFTNLTSPVASSFLMQILPMRILEPLILTRESRESRQAVIQALEKRVVNHDKGDKNEWYPILIFPEGTCWNRTAICNIKTSAFKPGVPVQPVYVEMWKDAFKTCDVISFTWFNAKTGIPSNFLLTAIMPMLRLDNSLTVHYLPVHNPSTAEKSNPKLYANNVRKTISDYSKLPVLDVCFEDGRLMSRFYENYKGDPRHAFCQVLRLFETYELTYSEIEACFDDYMSTFASFVDNETGVLKMKFFENNTDLDRKSCELFFGKTGGRIEIKDAVEAYCRAKQQMRGFTDEEIFEKFGETRKTLEKHPYIIMK